MEHRGVEIVDHELLLHHPVAIVVGGAHDRAPLHSSTSHPHGEGLRIVITAVAPLSKGSASEFAAPNHQRGFEQPPLAEVLDQGGDRLIDGAGVVSMPLAQIDMLIPTIGPKARAGQLDKPHPPLHHSAGEQAFVGKDLGRSKLGIAAIRPLGGCCLVGEIEQVGNRCLHPVGQFLIGDRALQGVGSRIA